MEETIRANPKPSPGSTVGFVPARPREGESWRGGAVTERGNLALPILKPLAALALMALLLARPQAAALGALRAMAAWAASVAPAVFPFLALMPLLTCDEAARAYEKLLGGLTARLFRLPGAAAPAMVIGMVAGVPAGPLAARSVAARTGLDRGQLQCLAIAAMGFSPAFLISGVGAGMLGSAALGWRLLLGQLLTQLTLLVATRRLWRDRLQPVEPLPEEAEASPVRSAVLVALTVCGYMALFGALTGALRAWIGRGASNALLCLLDVPSGARLLAASGVEARIKLPLLAGMCGFGGICVAAQNLRALKGCGIPAGEYLAARLLAAGLCAGFVALMARFDGSARLPFDAVRQNPLAAAALVACALSVPVLVKMRKSIS